MVHDIEESDIVNPVANADGSHGLHSTIGFDEKQHCFCLVVLPCNVKKAPASSQPQAALLHGLLKFCRITLHDQEWFVVLPTLCESSLLERQVAKAADLLQFHVCKTANAASRLPRSAFECASQVAIRNSKFDHLIVAVRPSTVQRQRWIPPVSENGSTVFHDERTLTVELIPPEFDFR